MKNILSISILSLIFCTNILSSQTATITNVSVNGTPISNCGTIAFGTNSTVTITYTMKVTKGSTVNVDAFAKFNVYTKLSSSSTPLFLDGLIVNNSAYTNGTVWEGTFSKVLQASDIAVSGSVFYGQYDYSSSSNSKTCEYAITKSPPPSFTFYPLSLSLACGDTSSKFFMVSPANIPNNSTLTYQWSYSNWSGTVNSSMNSINLTPSSGTFLTSAVLVTPYINGVAYPSMTCTVSRSAFTSIASISGSDLICTPTTSSSYSITNLGAGNTVTWSSSDTSVATVSSTSGNNITVNKVSDGIFNLIASITNSCGQFVDVSKIVRFGGAPVFAVLSGWIPQQPDISRISMVSIDPNIPLSAEGITATTWIEKLANGSTRNCATGTGLFTATVSYNSQYVTVTATNSCGTSTQVIDIIDLFGLGLEFRQNNTESTKEIIKTFPNPATDIINIELENTELSTKSNNIEAQLYDMMGQFREKVEFTNNKATFSVRDYPKGLYFLKVNIDGKIETEQIIVE